MNSKPGSVSLNDDAENTPQIIKHGWPDTKDYAEAVAETLAYVAENFPGTVVVAEPEIIQSEEHKAAGEYLVKILAL